MYKAVKDGKVIDVYKEVSCVRYCTAAKMFLRTEQKKAQGIIQRNGSKIYHVDGWPEIPEEAGTTETVTLEEITEEIYNGLLNALDQEDEVIDNQKDSTIGENKEDIEYIKKGKIKEIKKECERIIVEGIDLTLPDAGSGHFTFSQSNQSYIELLTTRAKNDNDMLPYHFDGEQDKNFTKNDILTLKKAMDQHVMYNRVYGNTLEFYIDQLENVQEINAVVYRNAIPEQFKTEILRQLEKEE